MKQAAAFFCFLLNFCLHAQQPDVQHYRFAIDLSDGSDSIKGTALIRYQLAKPANSVQFNLHGTRSGRGMQVLSVHADGNQMPFRHSNNVLQINFNQNKPAGVTQELTIQYAGVPESGLIISKNMHGDRTFFSDNWPNRAQHWIPCNDRPDDKASVEFVVTAPVHYQVISNGIQVEETNITANLKRTHWKENTPIPTKVMVIGAARMAVGLVDSLPNIPVTAWVYPQDREKGFHDYALTGNILRFFSQYIGPYAFQKLANVQSKTEFGGMENASAIFYAETSVTGDRRSEDLMAHEVAHQWFGNMATEKSFAHLWLSEGFATYLTNIYLEQEHGAAQLQDRLREDRDAVIQFARSNKVPVVYETNELMSLLNANSYQKGGWVLHMLRRKVGDAAFQKVLQTYYARYKGSNAETGDFRKIAEEVSGIDLNEFFWQWLYQPGVPHLLVSWKFSKGQVRLSVQQTGEELFDFPLELAFVDKEGRQLLHTLQVDKAKESFAVSAEVKPTAVLLDPNVNLLFDGSIREER